jgi:hypothetical protein
MLPGYREDKTFWTVVFPFYYQILRSVKNLHLYFNLNTSRPNCFRNVHVWNEDAKAQRTSSGMCTCNLQFRIFHPRQKLKISTISFMSLLILFHQNLSRGTPVKREGGDVGRYRHFYAFALRIQLKKHITYQLMVINRVEI